MTNVPFDNWIESACSRTGQVVDKEIDMRETKIAHYAIFNEV